MNSSFYAWEVPATNTLQPAVLISAAEQSNPKRQTVEALTCVPGSVFPYTNEFVTEMKIEPPFLIPIEQMLKQGSVRAVHDFRKHVGRETLEGHFSALRFVKEKGRPVSAGELAAMRRQSPFAAQLDWIASHTECVALREALTPRPAAGW